MDPEEFRHWGKVMVDYIADYWQNLRERKPISDVKPGYIRSLLPAEPPQEPESWENIFQDLEKIVVGPNTHWMHPHFFAYYPAMNSYPSVMGDMLAGALSCVGFTWKGSPSCTELELAVIDWLAKIINLPTKFLNSNHGPAAGMIQGSASEATLTCLLSARSVVCRNSTERKSELGSELIPRLVAYCSDQAHSSVERAALLGAVQMRKLQTNKEDLFGLRGGTLEKAVKEDLENGLIPFFFCASVGTTSTCAIDRVRELGEVCQKYKLWMHIDAAYAGNATICPEYRDIIDGVELADSFNFNAHKWLMLHFDCSVVWYKDAKLVEQAFHVDPVYLRHEYGGVVPDMRHWQIPLGRKFRSLKLWFVLRSIGVAKLQENIRNMCKLAQDFGELVETDSRFELFVPVTLALVCFRLKGSNDINEQLISAITKDRRIYLVASKVADVYFLRLAICSQFTTEADIKFAWSVICEKAEELSNTLIY